MGTGENAGNQQFLLFPQCFLPYQRNINLLTVKLISANAFNLVVSKILLLGKELLHLHLCRRNNLIQSS